MAINTVGELIRELKKFDKNLQVRIVHDGDFNGDYVALRIEEELLIAPYVVITLNTLYEDIDEMVNYKE